MQLRMYACISASLTFTVLSVLSRRNVDLSAFQAKTKPIFKWVESCGDEQYGFGDVVRTEAER